MKATPAYILRNCALWLNNDLKVGQASEMTIPPMKAKTAEMRNAGMVTDREARMGYTRENASFKETAFDPHTIGTIAGLSDDDTLMITGALVDEDGTTTNATCYMRGFVKGFDPGAWKAGEVAEIDVEFAWNYLKLEVGGALLIEADDFTDPFEPSTNRGDVRAALLLN